MKTAIHFAEDDHPEAAAEIEKAGRVKGLETGAFLVICWEKAL